MSFVKKARAAFSQEEEKLMKSLSKVKVLIQEVSNPFSLLFNNEIYHPIQRFQFCQNIHCFTDFYFAKSTEPKISE